MEAWGIMCESMSTVLMIFQLLNQCVTMQNVSSRPQLELAYLSPSSGVIQTPGFDGENPYPNDIMESQCLLLPPPTHHYHHHPYLLLSFPTLHLHERRTCSRDVEHLRIHPGPNCTGLAFLEACNIEPAPSLFNLATTTTTSLYFKPGGGRSALGDGRSALGFRVLFSFHSLPQLPEKLAGGLWNCSVSWWSQFRVHFECNLEVECKNGEDEEECVYKNETCGSGFVSWAGGCYQFVVPDGNLTWLQAQDVCVGRGGSLASLNSRAELSALLELLPLARFHVLFIGLEIGKNSYMPTLYQEKWIWTDGTVAHNINIKSRAKTDFSSCGLLLYLPPHHAFQLAKVKCSERTEFFSQQRDAILCEFQHHLNQHGTDSDSANGGILLHPPDNNSEWRADVVECPNGYYAHKFLACDVDSSCWSRDNAAANQMCSPEFKCVASNKCVAYTLVCDYRPDCSDGSDEAFCVFPDCHPAHQYQCLKSKQCFQADQRCDGRVQCLDRSDDEQCSLDLSDESSPKQPTQLATLPITSLPVKVRVDNDQGGHDILLSKVLAGECEELKTHFRCHDLSVCLPVTVRCNGVFDCPDHEDEEGCENVTCTGYYRCLRSSICLHPQFMCDLVKHCPHGDDELMCMSTFDQDLDCSQEDESFFRCPENCKCFGHAFLCPQIFPVAQFGQVRYLDATGSGLRPESLENNRLLVYLSLAHCGLTGLAPMDNPNLLLLDLSHNRLTVIVEVHVRDLKNLRHLTLTGNPLLPGLFTGNSSSFSLPSLRILDLSSVVLGELISAVMRVTPGLRVLNLSDSRVVSVGNDEGFQVLTQLRVLDVRGCSLTHFPKHVFKGLVELQTVFADNYRLCCPDTLPPTFPLPTSNCHAPQDELSSCESLLRSQLYRSLLVCFAVLALVGNLASFLYRTIFKSSAATKTGYEIFVSHLSVSDFLMGVYLSIIGGADLAFEGRYVWKEFEWTHSALCHVAGFAALVSSEVSVLLVGLITLDRFIVLTFPFTRKRFRATSAQAASSLAWLCGLLIATIPLLPITTHWAFYRQTGICIPLPITRKEFPGQAYSFGIFIVLNFLLFVLIAGGQGLIYLSIVSSKMSSKEMGHSSSMETSSSSSKDLTVARRLLTVVMSDFVCWFPICVLGVMTSQGVAVSGEVQVAMAIVVLPVNSALNPFLYTLNTLLEWRRRLQEERLERLLVRQLEQNT